MHSDPLSMLLTRYTQRENSSLSGKISLLLQDISVSRRVRSDCSQMHPPPSSPSCLWVHHQLEVGGRADHAHSSQLGRKEHLTPQGHPGRAPACLGGTWLCPGKAHLSLSSPGTRRALPSLCPDVSFVQWANSPRFGRNSGVQIPVALRTVAGPLRI